MDQRGRNLPEVACFSFRSRVNGIGGRKFDDASAFVLEFLLSNRTIALI